MFFFKDQIKLKINLENCQGLNLKKSKDFNKILGNFIQEKLIANAYFESTEF